MSGFSSLPPDSAWPGTAPPPPPPTEPAVVSPRRSRKPLVAALIAIVVVAATVGGIFGFRLLGGSADNLAALAPSDSVVYLNAHLDPSAGQKLALNGLLDKFPALGGASRDSTINNWLDQLLQETGLTHSDVRPWLGSDISVVFPSSALNTLSSSSDSTLDGAILVSSTNDSQAQAAIAKLHQQAGPSDRWETSTYDGVTVQVANGDHVTGTFAVTNHSLIIGSTEAAVHAVIDTAQGKHAALPSNPTYTTAVGRVPSDRIALAYVDLGAFAQALTKNAGSLFPKESLGSIAGYTGIAVAVVAHDNGVSITGVEDFDPSKLSSQQHDLVSQPGHVNGSLAFMPKNAWVAGTMGGLKQILQGAVDIAGSSSGSDSGFGFDLGSVLQQFGITGPDGLLDHLTGDAGIDVASQATDSTPGGAIIVGTDSDSAAQRFVDNLTHTICGHDCSSAVTTQHDGDATIESLALPPDVLGSGIQPSWSVYHGWIIVGSSAAQVKAALDADRSGQTLTSNPDYTAVMNQVGGSNNSSLFMDIQPMVSAIRATLSPADQSHFDSDVAPNLKPLKAFGVATHNASDHVSIDMFTLIR